jgi:hypothetical protein
MSAPTDDVYKARPRNDKRSFDLISDVLPFGRLWYAEPDALASAKIALVRETSEHSARMQSDAYLV